MFSVYSILEWSYADDIGSGAHGLDSAGAQREHAQARRRPLRTVAPAGADVEMLSLQDVMTG
jgi:hypothetical protein